MGTLIDKQTGKPISDAVIVRKFVKSVGMGGSQRLAIDEKVSNTDGRYSFPMHFFFYIPPFERIYDDIGIYKPGYEVIQDHSKGLQSEYALSQIPINKRVRKEALRSADNFSIHNKTPLLKQQIDAEEKNILKLPDINTGTGIFYNIDQNYGDNVNSIDFDNQDNLYLLTDKKIIIFKKTYVGYDINNPEQREKISSCTKNIDVSKFSPVFPDPKIYTAFEPVEVVTDKTGLFYIIYNYSSHYLKNNELLVKIGIAIFDKDKKYIGWQDLPIKSKVTGLAKFNTNIIVSDSDSFYIFDEHFKLIKQYRLPINIFGKVLITRIKLDPTGKFLLLLDRGYGRVLWFDLITNQWMTNNAESN